MNTNTATQNQMLDVLYIGEYGEKMNHHILSGDAEKNALMGLELGEKMWACVRQGAESAFLPSDDMVMISMPIPDSIKAKSRKLSEMGSEYYTCHFTDEMGTEGYAAYRVRIA